MLEDTLIEHAHTKPLLPSQLIRYREVQVPDGMYLSTTFIKQKQKRYGVCMHAFVA